VHEGLGVGAWWLRGGRIGWIDVGTQGCVDVCPPLDSTRVGIDSSSSSSSSSSSCCVPPHHPPVPSNEPSSRTCEPQPRSRQSIIYYQIDHCTSRPFLSTNRPPHQIITPTRPPPTVPPPKTRIPQTTNPPPPKKQTHANNHNNNHRLPRQGRAAGLHLPPHGRAGRPALPLFGRGHHR
jgi:hypothetical protein